MRHLWERHRGYIPKVDVSTKPPAGADNVVLKPHTVVPYRLVTAADLSSCVGRLHMCPPFRYSNIENKAVVLQNPGSANCAMLFV